MSGDSIEQLLSIPEELSSNLSDSQSFEILDSMLYNALYPIFVATNKGDEWLAEIMPLVSFDSRRKLCGVKKEKSIEYLFKATMASDPKTKLKYLKKVRLERGFTSFFLESIYKQAGDYLILHHKALHKFNSGEDKSSKELAEIESLLGADRQLLYPALQQSMKWFELYSRFKGIMAQKYYKHAWQKTVSASKMTHMVIDKKDLFENYVLAIYKAIDKFDVKKGVLKKHIESWFKNANINSEFNHQYSIGHSMPASARRALAKFDGKFDNWAYDITDVENEDKFSIDFSSTLEQKESMQIFSKFKPLSKRLKYFMLNAGIEYQLEEHEKALMQSTLE